MRVACPYCGARALANAWQWALHSGRPGRTTRRLPPPLILYTLHTPPPSQRTTRKQTPLAVRWIESRIRLKNAPIFRGLGPEIEPQDERRQEADHRGLCADWELPRGASGRPIYIDFDLNY